MRESRSVWQRRARLLSGLAAPVLLSIVPHAQAAEPPPPLAAPLAAPVPAAPQVFDLNACREYAVEHQPAVAAARDSLAAAQLKADAVQNIRGVAALISRDLPVRRQQAALGVSIAQAEVDAAEWDARYSATYCYLAALYAREQQLNAKDILESPRGLNDFRDLVNDIVKNGLRKDVTEKHKELVEAYRSLVVGRRAEADQGYERAIAALREAMNIGPGCRIELADQRLPECDAVPDKDQVIQLAVERRGEVIESALAEQVFCLEVDAQGRLRLPSARTFASGGDIHAKVLPAAEFDPVYRPGPVGPEMPPNLVGSKHERQDEAEAYHARSAAVAEKARNLVALEAEDSYLRCGAIRHRGEEARRGLQGLRRLHPRPGRQVRPAKGRLSHRGRRPQRPAKGDAGAHRGRRSALPPPGRHGQPGAPDRRRLLPPSRSRPHPGQIEALNESKDRALKRSGFYGDDPICRRRLPEQAPLHGRGRHRSKRLMTSSTWLKGGAVAAAGLVLAVGMVPAQAADAPPVRIGLVKTLFRDVPESLIEWGLRPMKALMEGQTGLSGDLIPSGDADHLACQLKDNDLQFGVFHGVEFAWVQQHYPTLKPLIIAVNEHPYLRALLVVRIDGKIAAPANLKGKVVALPRMSREHCLLFLERRCCPAGAVPETYFAQVSKSADVDDALDDVVDDNVQAAVVDEVAFDAYRKNKPGRAHG